MEEIEIVNGCKQGDCKAQRSLYDQYSPRLMSTIMRYVGGGDDAKDVLQEALLKILTSINGFQWRGAGSLRAWMERVAVNAALNSLRQNGQFLLREDDAAAADEEEEPTADDVESIDVDRLMKFIGELPQGYRTVFNMYCMDGYSHREIAEKLGINEKSSSSQLARAKTLLAKKIKRYLKEEVYE